MESLYRQVLEHDSLLRVYRSKNVVIILNYSMGDLFLLMPSMSSSHCLCEQFAGTVTHQCQPDSSWDGFLTDLFSKAGTVESWVELG